MDKICIVAHEDNKEALRVARLVREVRGMYVDDMRLWLQLAPLSLHRKWLAKQGIPAASDTDTVVAGTVHVSINGVTLEHGLPQLESHIPYWRGAKLSRDNAAADLIFLHIPNHGLSTATVVVADRRSRNVAVINPVGSAADYLRHVDEAEGSTGTFCLVASMLTHIPFDFKTETIASIAKLNLQQQRPCTIYTGPHRAVGDGVSVVSSVQTVPLSDVLSITAMPTPGHTEDSVTYIVGHNGVDIAAMTGCTLMVDTIGRTDTGLYLGEADDTSRAGAAAFCAKANRALYASLVELTTRLPDDAIIFPSHCGMQFSAHSVEPKWSCRLRLIYDGANQALNLIPTHKKQSREPKAGEEAFCAHCDNLTTVCIPLPQPFRDLHADNVRRLAAPSAVEGAKEFAKIAPETVLDVVEKEFVAYSANLRNALLHNADACKGMPVLIDVRAPNAFAAQHLIGSISFPAVEGVRFEHFLAAMIQRKTSLCIILITDHLADPTRLYERFSSVTLQHFLAGFCIFSELCDIAPAKLIGAFDRISSYKQTVQFENQMYVDVRSAVEFASQSVDNCEHVPLEALPDWSLQECKRRRVASGTGSTSADTLVAFCAGGYRSLIGASILRAFDVPATDFTDGGLTIMSTRPDIWRLKNPLIKCTS